MPSLRLLTISILVALGLVGGLAWAALTTGEVLGRGSADIAIGLIHVAPPSESATAPPAVDQKAPKDRQPPAGSTGSRPRASATRAVQPSRTKPAVLKHASRPTPTPSSSEREPRTPRRPAPRALANVKSDKSVAANRWLSKRLLTARRDAPTCDGVHVYIVSAFENPSDSVATLALDSKKRGRQRRVGQRLGPYEVIAIGYNPSRVSSAVWLARGGSVCQALVRDVNPVREKAYKRQVRRAAKARAKQRARKKRRARKAKRRRRR